jgi:hypothetical protein
MATEMKVALFAMTCLATRGLFGHKGHIVAYSNKPLTIVDRNRNVK